MAAEPCPVCGHVGHIEISLYQRYGALYVKWLPVFGMGVRAGAVCTLCGQVIKDPFHGRKRTLSGTLRTALAEIRGGYRRTLWQRLYPWSLTIVLGAVIIAWIGGIALSEKAVEHRDAQARERIMNPMVGDIYKVWWMADQGPMTGALLKVVSVDEDTLTLLRSTDSIDDVSSTDAWAALSRDAAGFDGGEYTVSLSHLQGDVDDDFGEFYGLEGQPWERQYAVLLEGRWGVDNIVERTEE